MVPSLENYKMKSTAESQKELIERLLVLEKERGRRPKKRDNNSLYKNSRRLFGSWNKMMEAAGYEVRFIQKVESITFDNDFYYFLGLLITDGHICRVLKTKDFKIAIYTSYPEERELIIKLIKKLFNYNAYFSSKFASYNKKPNYEIRVCSKGLVNLLIDKWSIPSGSKSSIVRIPRKIKEGDLKAKQSFVRGVIDGDGSITKYGIKITSGSILFLEDLKKLLINIGIRSGSVLKERETTFTLRINRHLDLLKIKAFYGEGSYYPRKKESLNKI
ncbi:MAG: LAGLIDADG family homing endonuclease [Candidatus Woesearchaeota archaeon]